MMDVKHFPVYLNQKELPNDALKVIKNIRCDWKEVDVRFKVFTEGITNKLIGCYCVKDPNDLILVRVYGDKTDLFIDRTAEVLNFKLMNSKGYAPKLYATFDNGMVYDYVPGEVLDVITCRDETIHPLVAKMLAKMHKLSYEENIPKVPCVWQKIENLIDLIPECYSSTENQFRFNQYFQGGKQVLKNELKGIQRVLENVDNPVVFCHNDLLLANVIYHKNPNAVTFIDYEYAAYNYQAFDIANHFAEFAGVTEFDCSLYPSEEFQLNWIRLYLKEYNNSCTINDDCVRQLYKHVCQFTPVTHFFWAMWSLVQLQHSVIDFDYLEYALLRYHEYKKFLHHIHCAEYR